MQKKALFPFMFSVFCVLPLQAQEDPVVNAMRQEGMGSETKNKVCLLMAEAGGSVKVTPKRRKAAIKQLAANLRDGDVATLRARGDAARLGLYGIKTNLQDSMRFYQAAIRQGSAEAAFNVSIYLLQQANYRPDEVVAKKILSTLLKNTVTNYNAKGEMNSHAYFITAQIYQYGWTGEVDLGKAFLAYRASARNGYVPGIYSYLLMLSGAYPKMGEQERRDASQEINILTGRWKWATPGIMRLTGDFHAMNVLQDQDGFMAQYHWRLARHLATQKPEEFRQELDLLKTRIKTLEPLQERRLESARQAAIKNNQPKAIDKSLRYVSLCT